MMEIDEKIRRLVGVGLGEEVEVLVADGELDPDDLPISLD